MPVEVELGIPVSNPVSQSEYSQHLRKAIQKANSLVRQQLEESREQQCTSYDKGHKNWSPFESGQTVWLLPHQISEVWEEMGRAIQHYFQEGGYLQYSA